MKIDRYEMYTRFDGSVELVIDPDGSVCYTRDVAKLEAINAELVEACESLLRFAERDRLPTDVAVNDARAAIVKVQGGMK